MRCWITVCHFGHFCIIVEQLFIRFPYLARYWTICGFYTLLWLFAIWFGVRHVLKVDQHCRIWQVFEEQIIVLDSLVRMMIMVSLFLKVTTEAPKFSSRSGWGDLLVIKLPAKSPTIRWWWLPQWWSMEMSATFDWPKSLHLQMFIKLPTPGERCRPPLCTFPAPLHPLFLLPIFLGTSRLQPPYSLFPHKVLWQIFILLHYHLCP